MRLWHQKLIQKLPRQQLLGQHRECCALRGKGWGRKHATVDYVFKYSIYRLYLYHYLIMEEMRNRGYKVNELWHNWKYRGKLIGYQNSINIELINDYPIYPEHDDAYLKECIENLEVKGVVFNSVNDTS